MAQDRGGLRYTIEIVDAFSKASKDFRDEIAASRAAFRDFRSSLSEPLSVDTSLKDSIKSARELASATKVLAKEREKARTNTRQSEQAESRLTNIQQAQASRIKEIAAAAKDANRIASKNITNSEQEARIREKVAAKILQQTAALQELRLLSANDRLLNGLKTEQEAWKRNEKAIQANAVELAQLRQLQAQGNRNIRGEAPKDVVEKDRLRLLRQLKEAEEAARVAADKRFAVDARGKLTLAPLIQAEREYTALLNRRAQEEAKLALLAKENRGADGLTAEQRALRAYNAELQKLATNEERLRLIREKTDDNFVERSARIRGEERATRALIETKARLRALEVGEGLRDSDGRSLAELKAEETAETRIRREKERQAAAQAEINLRQRQGLPISKKLRDEARGTANETERLNRAANRSIFSFRRLFLIFGAFEAVRAVLRSFRETVTAGVRFNSTLEQSEIAIAALIAATSDFPGLFGQGADAAQRLEFSLVEARKQNALLRQDALRTTATYEELVSNFQLAVAPGVSAGGSLDQIRAFTVQITQAASALGLANNQLSEEIRNIIQGTINIRTTRIAAALGITNEDIRRAREAGRLFQFLQTEFSAFNEAGIRVQETFSGLANRIRDAFSQITGAASIDFFDELKRGLNDVLDLLGDFDPFGEIRFNDKAIQVFKEIFDALEDVVVKAREFVDAFTFKEVQQAAETVGNAIRAIGTVLFAVVDGIVNAFQRLNGISNDLASILDTDGASKFLSFLSEWGILLVLVNSVTSVLAKAWQGLRGIGTGLLKIIVGAAEVFGKLGFNAKNLGLAFSFLKGTLASLVSSLAAIAAPVTAVVAATVGVVATLDAVAENITGVELSWGQSLQVMYLKLLEFVNRGRRAFFSFLRDVFEDTKIGSVFEAQVDKATAAVDRFSNKVEEIKRGVDLLKQLREIEGPEGSFDAFLPAERELVQVSGAFDEVSRTASVVREDIENLASTFEDLEKQTREGAAAFAFEVDSDGLDLQQQEFKSQFEITEKTRDLQRTIATAQGQINAALRERTVLEDRLRLLDLGAREAVLGRVKDYRTINSLQREAGDLQTEINRLQSDIALEDLPGRRQALKDKEAEKQAFLDILNSQIEILTSRERTKGIDKELLALSAQLSENEELRAVRAGDILELRKQEADLIRQASEVNVSRTAADVVRRQRALADEQATLREQLRTQREITGAVQSGASARRLAKLEQEANLRLLEQETRQQTDLTETQAAFFELKAQEAVLNGQFNEAAVIASIVVQLREQIKQEKQLLALKKGQIVAEGSRADTDFRTSSTNSLRISEQQVRVLEEQAILENSLLAATQARLTAEEVAVVNARGEAALARVRRSRALGELKAKRDVQETEVRRLSAANDLTEAGRFELQAAEILLRQLNRRISAEQAVQDAKVGQADAATEQLKVEQQIAALQGQFDRESRSAQLRQESAEMRQQLAIAQADFQIVQRRLSAAQQAVVQARVQRDIAASEGRLALDALNLRLRSLDTEKEMAVLQGDDDNLEQIKSEIRDTQTLLVQQQGINDVLEARYAILVKNAEEINGRNIFKGLEQGAVDFANSLPTLFQAGAAVAESSLNGLADTLSTSVLIALDPNVEDKDKAIKDAFEQLGLQIAQELVNQLVRSLIQTALSSFSAGITLQTSASIAGATLQTSATTAAVSLQIGGQAAGSALVIAAGKAASILAGTSLTGGLGGYTGGRIPGGGIASGSHFGPGAMGYAGGGHIRRPRTASRFSTPFAPKRPAGIDRRDTTPIWAQPGEYMMRLAAVKKYGVGFMRMLNAGSIPLENLPAAKASHVSRRGKKGYASGGLIGGSSGSSIRGGSSGAITPLPVLVADDQSVRRFLAGGQNGALRWMTEMGFRPGGR